jgi:hypothetical protein
VPFIPRSAPLISRPGRRRLLGRLRSPASGTAFCLERAGTAGVRLERPLDERGPLFRSSSASSRMSIRTQPHDDTTQRSLVPNVITAVRGRRYPPSAFALRVRPWS